MPLTEARIKDLRFAAEDLVTWLRNGFRLPVIVAWPDFPGSRTTLRKIATELGMRLTNKLHPKPDVVIYFEDQTFGNSEALSRRYSDRKVLNAACTNISKKYVDGVHTEIFGYSTIIDPLTYHGLAVVKSDLNALHDGREIQCPVESAIPDVIYQVLIDNSAGENLVMDYRVPVLAGVIPVVYRKFKTRELRFTNEVSYSEIAETASVFTAEECELVLRFATRIGADFCELDILRNKTDGRIYVIDVNKTPYGPPAGLPLDAGRSAVKQLAAAFRNFLDQEE